MGGWRGERGRMVSNQNFHISARLHSFSFNKVLRNVIMTWARDIYRLFSSLTLKMWHWWCCKQQKKQELPSDQLWRHHRPAYFPHRTHQAETEMISLQLYLQNINSCYVAVLICRGLAPFNVLFVYQNFNTLLNHADTWVKPSSWLANYLCKGEKKENLMKMLPNERRWGWGRKLQNLSQVYILNTDSFFSKLQTSLCISWASEELGSKIPNSCKGSNN